jgi:tetratricopeptide (TPR) repeat protein
VKSIKVSLAIMMFAAFGILAPAALTQGKPDVPRSDIEILRNQITVAANEYDRGQLQVKLVDFLVSKGLKQEAIAELQSFSREERFNPQGFYNLANAQARLGDSEGAVSTYRKAIEQRKGRYSKALNNLGVILLRLGRWDEAYDAFMGALRLESFRYPEAGYNLGRLYALRGETDLAVREWRRVLAVNPDHSAAAKAIASAGTTGNITVAPRLPKPSDKSPAETRPMSSPKRAAGDKEPAAKPRAVAKNSRAFTLDAETYNFLQRARSDQEKGRHNQAVDQYRRVIAQTGGYFPPANLELAYSLISLKRNDEAMASLLPVAMKDGDRFPISYYHVARLYELRGELKLAEENYARVADIYGSSNSQFLLDLSRVREKLGNVSGALASLEKYLEILDGQGQKPAWSAERLAALRLKASQMKQ